MATSTDLPGPATSVAPLSIADPGPLGLSAFAATTFVLSLANAKVIDTALTSVVLSLALFYGGAVQVVAGVWEFRKGNTFGATAFCSYGGFWLAYWGLSVFFNQPPSGASANAVDDALGWFLLTWAIFTAIMLVAALRTNAALVVVFVILTLTFLLLAFGHFAQNDSLDKLGGWAGILTALAAWYAAAAGIINETWKRPLLPLGPM